MGRIRNTMRTLGQVADVMMERNVKIDAMQREIQRRTFVDPVEARKIAKVLVDQADVTWK